MTGQTSEFGTLPDGRIVERVAIAGGGLRASVLSYGAILQDLRLDGCDFPLTLGAPDLASYLGPMRYAGALCGRFANRLGGGRFKIAGRPGQANRNFLDRHTLHGGREGASDMLWQIEGFGADWVTLSLILRDGHMGFPGDLSVTADIRLPGEGVLAYEITAKTTAPTLCSFAQHSYYNLDGQADTSAHSLQVFADHYLPVDGELIPTGVRAPVVGTRFDFRAPSRLDPGVYDHNFCLSETRVPLRPVAILSSHLSGVTLEMASTEPGLQVYDAGHFDGVPGLDGRVYGPRAGIALEPQVWPDAPNLKRAPRAELHPGETYRQVLRLRFQRG